MAIVETASTSSDTGETDNAVTEVEEERSASSESIIAKIERDNLLSSDYMAVVIPLLIALAGSFITFLGMERLKSFDERIDTTRNEIREELSGFDAKIDESRKEIRDGFEQFRESIEKNHGEIKSEIPGTVKREIANEKNEILEAIKEQSSSAKFAIQTQQETALKELGNNLTKIKKEYEELQARFGWVKVALESSVNPDVPTIEDAHRLVERLRAEISMSSIRDSKDKDKSADQIARIRDVVDLVCGTDSHMSGDFSDYHNLSAELARGSMYYEAVQVLEKGLSLFRDDVDLWADLVEYSTKGGMREKAKAAVRYLRENVDEGRWNWRCYEFICDYYRAIGDLKSAYQIANDGIQAIPDAEQTYRSKAEIERQLYPGQEGIKRAKATFHFAMDQGITCPQCANALAELCIDTGEYEEAVEAANRAVRDLAQQQPHVNGSFVFFNRATARDRMFLSLSRADKEKDENRLLAEEAYQDYNMALSLGRLTPTVRQQANMRLRLLKPFVPSEIAEQSSADNGSGGPSLLDILQGLQSTQDMSDDS